MGPAGDMRFSVLRPCFLWLPSQCNIDRREISSLNLCETQTAVIIMQINQTTSSSTSQQHDSLISRCRTQQVWLCHDVVYTVQSSGRPDGPTFTVAN